MLDALAYVFAERRKMMDAMLEMGHADVVEVEPRDMLAHLELLKHGQSASIGSPEDPFQLLGADRRLIARYYIEADNQCLVRVSGSVEFMEALARIQARWRSELH